MQSPRKIAVAGATGRVGRHTVDVLKERGHDVVPMSRSQGVDVITGDGLAAALADVDCVIDALAGPSPEQQAATTFFTTAAANLHQAGQRTGVSRMIVVSIIGADRSTAGYGPAKVAHETAHLSGPIPARVLRAAQFHELVGQLVDWGTRGDVAYVPKDAHPARRGQGRRRGPRRPGHRTATRPGHRSPRPPGPREENLVEMARLLAARRGYPPEIEDVSDPADPDRELNENGALLPGPGAILTGPPFAEWLDSAS